VSDKYQGRSYSVFTTGGTETPGDPHDYTAVHVHGMTVVLERAPDFEIRAAIKQVRKDLREMPSLLRGPMSPFCVLDSLAPRELHDLYEWFGNRIQVTTGTPMRNQLTYAANTVSILITLQRELRKRAAFIEFTAS